MTTDDLRYAEERQTHILDALHQDGRVDVNSLAVTFGVSAQTIRRDLAEMEKRHLLQRTHGGAILPTPSSKYDATFSERQTRHIQEKQRIGTLVSDIVNDGETLVIDAGTTTLEVARKLQHKQDLTVVTNALNICAVLSEAPGIELFVPGGQYLGSNRTLVGSSAEAAIRQFNFDKAIIGTSAVDFDRNTLCMPNLPEARIQQAIVSVAKTIVVVADHSKFGHNAFVASIALDHVDMVVSDAQLSVEYQQALEAFQITVMTA